MDSSQAKGVTCHDQKMGHTVSRKAFFAWLIVKPMSCNVKTSSAGIACSTVGTGSENLRVTVKTSGHCAGESSFHSPLSISTSWVCSNSQFMAFSTPVSPVARIALTHFVAEKPMLSRAVSVSRSTGGSAGHSETTLKSQT